MFAEGNSTTDARMSRIVTINPVGIYDQLASSDVHEERDGLRAIENFNEYRQHSGNVR